MFSLTVFASINRVRFLLRELGVTPIECDFEDASTTVVTLRDEDVDAFRLDCRRFGIRADPGRPRGSYSDPTFVRAAQHIALRERGDA